MTIGYASHVTPDLPEPVPCGRCGHAEEEHSDILGCAFSTGGAPIECSCLGWEPPDPPEEQPSENDDYDPVEELEREERREENW